MNAAVLNLQNSVDYQTDAVVSKIIFKEKGGSLTLFAFDKGQELSEHSTPHHALLLVLDGEAQVSIAGEQSAVPAGALIVLPANVPHAVAAKQRFKMSLTMIKSGN
ncbi:MAG: cupin domain-containing protein [Deferribacteres bacterium]|nr:cupin domain-containing protein [candidate division KSB1 bacterium]MCB9511096.1 cupin domain-containing protein [Deferribacteres bacterium]